MLQRFFRSEPAAAIVLFCAAVLAMVVANSPWQGAYDDLFGAHLLGITLHHWVNDGLMAVFFLLVGLEIRQEMTGGELATWRSRALPGIAAVGGMIAPAIVFVAINAGSSEHLRGWAIPTATDIAFAIGVLSLLGPRVPAALRLLLVGIAIMDDLGAILVIATFYTAEIEVPWLILSGVVILALAACNRRHVYALPPYVILGVILWWCVYQSGIHATLAGVVLAFAIPARSMHGQHRSPMKTTEHTIDRWVSFLILPLFGFANAGIAFGGLGRSDVFGTLPLGIAAGLVLGKQIGVYGAIRLSVRLGVAERPAGVSWRAIYALAMLCGIGFTMSLFIGGLAFASEPHLMEATKVGIVGGSVISAIAGALTLRWCMTQGADSRAEISNVSAAGGPGDSPHRAGALHAAGDNRG